MIRRLARQAIASFVAWRHARRLAKASPEIVELQLEIEKRSRGHRKTEPLRRELRARVTARLAREQGLPAQERKFT